MAATGGVITAAAVIMISLFASFAALSDDLTTKLFGVGLATTICLTKRRSNAFIGSRR